MGALPFCESAESDLAGSGDQHAAVFSSLYPRLRPFQATLCVCVFVCNLQVFGSFPALRIVVFIYSHSSACISGVWNPVGRGPCQFKQVDIIRFGLALVGAEVAHSSSACKTTNRTDNSMRKTNISADI